MPLKPADRAWFIDEIRRRDPSGEVVTVPAGDTHVVYADVIRSDETKVRQATPEELVRALSLALLCEPGMGYRPEAMYIEQTHSIGRPSTSTAQVDLILFYSEGSGAESPFAMWEMKEPGAYRPQDDPLIEEQLFNTAPLINPSLLVYSTIVPQRAEIECITIDYTMHKTYAGWHAAGRPAT